CALVSAVAIWNHEPPGPAPADAPSYEFSATRAVETLRRVLGDSSPHPVGSAANARVRERILAELARLGYQPTVQKGFACGRWSVCAEVADILARRPGNGKGNDKGKGNGKAVMISAHYDSVASGPGASDDGVGVATLLEVARALANEKPSSNPILFLLTDGEEAGLLGASAFVAERPSTASVGAVINVDARGTSGASILFETSDDNGWLIELAARSIRRPVTSSL